MWLLAFPDMADCFLALTISFPNITNSYRQAGRPEPLAVNVSKY
jgi:hypothetical protein